jgi:hypothetical protein
MNVSMPPQWPDVVQQPAMGGVPGGNSTAGHAVSSTPGWSRWVQPGNPNWDMSAPHLSATTARFAVTSSAPVQQTVPNGGVEHALAAQAAVVSPEVS